MEPLSKGQTLFGEAGKSRVQNHGIDLLTRIPAKIKKYLESRKIVHSECSAPCI